MNTRLFAHLPRHLRGQAGIALAALAFATGCIGSKPGLPGLYQSPSGLTTQALPAVPAAWPYTTLQLGTADSPGGAAAMKATAPYGFRYQYLSAGVNTGNGWATWNSNGQFATFYIQDSVNNGIVPVFTYYMMRQSNPGAGQGEADGNYNNLQNVQTMTAYYNDLKLFFQRAGAFPQNKVVLHVEPDLWGYLQQRAANDDATSVPAKVASTGLSELAGLPENIGGFAKAIKKLRDTYAPNVVLGYHMSIWGTGADIVYSNPDNATIDGLAQRAANFYKSLATAFDVSFAEFSDRDAAFKQFQYGDAGTWFDAGDFGRHVRFMGDFSAASGTRVVLWQIPEGNTKMRAMDNTWDHYQDNRVEWLLDDATRAHLQDYINAGVVAFLFGRGADGATCACDAAGDGVTNPAAINGNTGTSINADDDGGFFHQKSASYYSTGAMTLTGTAISTPTPTATATRTPTRTPTATRTPSATATSPPVRVPAGEAPVPITAANAPSIAGCPVFPADNAWNQDISTMPVDTNSATYITSAGQSGNGFLHADFGSFAGYGIPYVVVPSNQPAVPINYVAYGDESDPGPFPVPLNAPIEQGSDAHVVVVQQGACMLYELFNAQQAGTGWNADSGAKFDLRSNALRPDTWTSADAAGLPIFAGLVRYDEVASGSINHAVRFTVGTVQKAWVHPATHYGTSTSAAYLPYGAKLRLKTSFDVSTYHGQARVILNALKKYGMIVADQGTSWYITGAPDPRWDDTDLNQLKSVPGSAFEVVQLGTMYHYP